MPSPSTLCQKSLSKTRESLSDGLTRVGSSARLSLASSVRVYARIFAESLGFLRSHGYALTRKVKSRTPRSGSIKRKETSTDTICPLAVSTGSAASLALAAAVISHSLVPSSRSLCESCVHRVPDPGISEAVYRKRFPTENEVGKRNFALRIRFPESIRFLYTSFGGCSAEV